MTWVKVCGVTRAVDVEVAVAAGADAVGFVVAAGSPRRLALEEVAGLAAGLPLLTVLVTVDLPADRVLDALEVADVGGLQPHGRFAAAAARIAVREGYRVLRPVPVGPRGPLVPPEEIPDDETILFDTAGSGHGGSGRSFAWDLVAGVRRPFVLAGGLGPGTVGEAVARVRPWGVDAASGLERAPGVKDHGKVRAFIEEAKAW